MPGHIMRSTMESQALASLINNVGTIGMSWSISTVPRAGESGLPPCRPIDIHVPGILKSGGDNRPVGLAVGTLAQDGYEANHSPRWKVGICLWMF